MNAEPNHFYNWYAYAEVLMLLVEYEEAITLLKNATQKNHREELFYQMSNCYFQLKNDDEGRKIKKKTIKIKPNFLEDMQQKYSFINEEAKKVKARKK